MPAKKVMMLSIRAVVYNFIKEQAEIIKNLVAGRVIDVVEWFCYPPHGTVDIRDFADVNYGLEDSYGLGEEIYEDVFKFYPVFLDMHQRRYPYFENNIYDSLNDFNRQFGAVYSLLIREKPDLVIFGNIPHGGHDFLLYQIAKALHINTLILFQVPICARFFVLGDLQDFGVFSEYANSDTGTEVNVPEIKPPFYVKTLLKKRGILLHYLKKIRNKKIGLYSLINRDRQIKYQKDIKKYVKSFSDKIKFVYFPLHLQPEMTTSAIGGKYVDQLLAVEHLSRHLPNDFHIVLKENPKQNAYQRPHSFFERLSAIPKVTLVASNEDTYELIRKSIFVATITGTAGWEAINMGKPALIFGKAWYESLPGVFKYNKHIDIPSMIRYEVKKSDVESGYLDLMRRAYPGIISSPYFELNPGLDFQKNNSLVTAALEKIIIHAIWSNNISVSSK